LAERLTESLASNQHLIPLIQRQCFCGCGSRGRKRPHPRRGGGQYPACIQHAIRNRARGRRRRARVVHDSLFNRTRRQGQLLFVGRAYSKEVPAKRRVRVEAPHFLSPTMAAALHNGGRCRRGREHAEIQQQAHTRRANGACCGGQGRSSGVQHVIVWSPASPSV
jgi:hypothetical protein